MVYMMYAVMLYTDIILFTPTILATIMWDKLAECTASTIDQFFTWKQTFFGPNPTFPPSPSPSPPMLFVRKGLPISRPTLHRGGGGGGGVKGGASEYCSNSGKRHFVPHILARIVERAHIFQNSVPHTEVSHVFTTKRRGKKSPQLLPL